MAEHRAVRLMNGVYYKELLPDADLRQWRKRQEVARRNPDLFVPFAIVGRTIVQQEVHGAFTLERQWEIILELRRRKLYAVSDVTPENIVGGRLVDFQWIE